MILNGNENTLPALNGLVLAGGRSTRMGRDKGLMAYHGRPQREVAFGQVRAVCSEVFLSVNAGQVAELDGSLPYLTDAFPDAGPIGGLLTAFAHRPDSAWLVLACDLPFLTAATIQFLVEHRDPTCRATAFRSPTDGLPEPLVAIWEPGSYAFLKRAFASGRRSLRRVLSQFPVALPDAPDPAELRNLNEPTEAKPFSKPGRNDKTA